jgi:hypothetical protein
MDPRLIQAMANARKPIALNVKPGNSVLIVADTATEHACLGRHSLPHAWRLAQSRPSL